MKSFIIHERTNDNGGMFILRWHDGRAHSKQWTYKPDTREDKMAAAAAFRRDLLEREKDNVAKIKVTRYDDGRGLLKINWTENGSLQQKRYSFTPSSYEQQMANAQAYRLNVVNRILV